MPSNLVSQVDILTASIPKINDAFPGSSYAGPTNQATYGSQVGARFALGNDDPMITRQSALFGGMFQYVQFYASQTATPTIGNIAFWQTDTTYVVTSDEPTGVSDIAGILVSAPTKGNYGVIQIDGKVAINFRATITKATPAIGDLVLAAAAGAGVDNAKADVLADATNITSVQFRHVLGIAVVAPVGGSAKAVRLGAGVGQRMNF